MTEPDSEDTNSQISSCHSFGTRIVPLKLQKRRRSSSSSLKNSSSSPTSSKKHATLFGELAPKRSKDKDRGGDLKRKSSIDPENTIAIANGEIELMQFIQDCGNNPRRKEIEFIKLSKVAITDHEKILGKKVRFPKLKEFHLDIKISSLKHKEVNALASEITLENYLFFILKVGKKWPLSEIWSLGINISFIINGITLIKIDHGRKMMVVNKVKDCTKILESVDDESNMRSLIISQPSFPGDSDLYSTSSLERLVLLRIDKIPEFNNFTKKFKRLKELCISSSDNKTMDFSRDLSQTSRDRLRKLSLASTKLFASSVTNNNVLKSLEELFLFRCDWESGFEDIFPTLFPSLKRAYFFLGHKLTAKLLFKLFQLKSVTEIGCGSFDWDLYASEKAEGINGYSSTVDVLQSAGLTENDKSFVLTKEGDGDRDWAGKKGSMELSQEEIFKNFQFYHIYSDYALFRS